MNVDGGFEIEETSHIDNIILETSIEECKEREVANIIIVIFAPHNMLHNFHHKLHLSMLIDKEYMCKAILVVDWEIDGAFCSKSKSSDQVHPHVRGIVRRIRE